MAASILKIGISQNANCDNLVSFPKSDWLSMSKKQPNDNIFFKYWPYVTGFGKTDHNVIIDISRNTDLKY